VALTLCQSDLVLNSGYDGIDKLRDFVIERLWRSLIEKVVRNMKTMMVDHQVIVL
jgi:hypothetical protein